MSINIPEKYSKEEFNKLMNKTLKGNDFSQYQALFRESYKKPPKGATEYQLKDGISIDVKKKMSVTCFPIEKSISSKKELIIVNIISMI